MQDAHTEANKPYPTPELDRNALCHCGSNRKYKKCCLETDNAKTHQMLKLISCHPAMQTRGGLKLEPSFMHPWENPFYVGVGKYAPKQEFLPITKQPEVEVAEVVEAPSEDKTTNS